MSVTNAVPFLKNIPPIAGNIANASGVECHVETSESSLRSFALLIEGLMMSSDSDRVTSSMLEKLSMDDRRRSAPGRGDDD